jgi:hypothetical protein
MIMMPRGANFFKQMMFHKDIAPETLLDITARWKWSMNKIW